MARLAKHKKVCRAARAALLGLALLGAGLLLATGSAFADDKSQAPSASQPATSQPPAASPAPTVTAPSVPAQPPIYKPGFLHQLKVWWDDSVAVFESNRGIAADPNKKPDETAPAAAQPATADAAKDAPKGAPKDAPKGYPKEAPKETAKEAAKDAPKSPVTATQDAMRNAVEVTKSAATAVTDAMKNAVDATKNAAEALVRLPNTRVVDVHEPCTRAPNGGHDCAAAAATGCRGKGYSDGKPVDVRTAQKCEPKPLPPGQMPGMQCAAEAVVIRAACQ
jgi:hypothetical protein